MRVLSRWLGFAANGEEAKRHCYAGEPLRGRLWKCSSCGPYGPYSLPLSPPQFVFPKGKPSGHVPESGVCSPWRQEVCVWPGLSQILSESLHVWSHGSPCSFPKLVFLGHRYLWSSLRQSNFLRGEKRRWERREAYFQELAHMIMVAGKSKCCPEAWDWKPAGEHFPRVALACPFPKKQFGGYIGTLNSRNLIQSLVYNEQQSCLR